MSFVPKTSKNSSSENIENNNENTRKMRKRRLSLDLNQPVEEMRPQIVLALPAVGAPKLKHSGTSKPLHDEHVIHEEPDYCGNFFPEKFTNKQALGGHQNTHNFENATKKRAFEGQEGKSTFTGEGSSNDSRPFAFPSSFTPDLKMGELHQENEDDIDLTLKL